MGDHDRTVLEARENMADFDSRRVLERWLQNYVHPEIGVPAAYWCAVTKHEKRWRVEYGLLSGTEAVAWCVADPGAPEPPILEFRKPKPEPVKPRFNNKELKVPSRGPEFYTEYTALAAEVDRRINEAFMMPSNMLPPAKEPSTATLTLERLRQIQDRMMPKNWRLDPLSVMPNGAGYETWYEERDMQWRIRYWGMSPLRTDAPMIVGVDPGSRPSETAIVEFKAPVPTPSKRNQ